MGEKLLAHVHRERKALFAFGVLAIELFYMLWYVNFFLAQSIKSHYCMYFVPVLAAFYLYFRGFRDGQEIRLLIYYSAWLFITRLLNRDAALAKDGWIVVDSLMMFCFAGFASVAGKEKGEKVLTIVAVAAGVYYFVIGCISVYHWVRLDSTVNPLTEAIIGVDLGYSTGLIILGENRNIAALWFYIAASLLGWLFFKCRRGIWRIPIVLAILVDYLVIAGCYSRNVRLVFSFSVGLLLFLLLLRSARVSKAAVRVIAASLVLLVSTLLLYESFEWTAQGVSVVSYAVRHRDETAPAPQRMETEDIRYEPQLLSGPGQAQAIPLVQKEAFFGDERSMTDDNGRLQIYQTVPEIFRRFPYRLLKGCLDEDRMALTNELLSPHIYVHLHNSFLDILNYTGIPGVVLALAFCVVLAGDMLRVFFSKNKALTVADRVLVIPLAGILFYSMLETLIFMKQDFRSLSFFLIAGFVILYSKQYASKQEG